MPTLQTKLTTVHPTCQFLSCQIVRITGGLLLRILVKNFVEMADIATEIPINIEETVKETLKNATDKPVNSIEGIAIAYLSLVIMAILPIFFGAFRSVKYLKEQKVSDV